MEGQDWTTTNVGRGTVGGGKALPKTKTAMAQALRTGAVQSERKYAAGMNSSAHSGANVNARKVREVGERPRDDGQDAARNTSKPRTILHGETSVVSGATNFRATDFVCLRFLTLKYTKPSPLRHASLAGRRSSRRLRRPATPPPARP
mmetsp:Transcript_22642/g.45206  ORF Transcript_22642/g.45206 Transcript_22642/m.45206 type:complete len:148 (-) Transcript_22642:408-851(-)